MKRKASSPSIVTGHVLLRVWLTSALSTAMLLITAAIAAAQFTSTSSIEGAVSDETGAALPGVAVTIKSPALQVPQLDTVTDAAGRYRFPQLPAGTYSLRFELSGFQTVVRQDLQVGVGFAARLDMPMKIGSLNESITVTGASPVVDVTTTTGAQTLTSAQVNSVLPTSRMVSDVLRLAQGVRSTAPPAFGMLGVTTSGGFESYGGSSARYLVDGVDVRNNSYPDMSSSQEVDIKSFGNGAEAVAPGLVMNIVTKSGGNDFHGRYGEQYMHRALQSDNLNDTLRAQGLTSGDAVRYFSDLNSDLGGRMIRDKLWFYGNFRQRQNERTVTGFVANAGPDGRYGTGDEPPYYPSQITRNVTGKLSYQASQNYQLVAFYAQDNHQINAILGGTLGGLARYIPRESSQDETFNPTNWRGELRATPRANLLFNAQAGRVCYLVDYFAPEEFKTTVVRFNR
jgi:hypothetical protein